MHWKISGKSDKKITITLAQWWQFYYFIDDKSKLRLIFLFPELHIFRVTVKFQINKQILLIWSHQVD